MLAPLLLLLAAGPTPAPAPAPGTASASAVLLRVQKAYTASPAFVSSFVQAYAPSGFPETSPETGKLVLQAPNLVRFDYDGREGKVFTFDGHAARQYVAQDKQVIVKTLTADDKLRLPLLFFESPEAILLRFDAVVKGADNGLTEVALTPKSGDEPKKLVLLTDAGGDVKRLVVLDGSGNRTTFHFTQRTAVSKARPASDFALVPPPGTKVITE